GVVTEVELALLPKPEGFFSGIVFFDHEGELLAFVDEARERRDATLIEYFDRNSLGFVAERFPETPNALAGAIFFEQETSSETEDAVFASWNRSLERHRADLDRSWFATNDEDREKMRKFRHAMPLAANERF